MVSKNNVSSTSRSTVVLESENAKHIKSQTNTQTRKKLNANTCKHKNLLQQKILVLKRTLLFAVMSLVSFVVSHIVIHYFATPDGHV